MYSGLKIPNRRMIHNLLLQLKIKFRPLSIYTFYLQPAAHKRKELYCNVHAKPGAFYIVVPVLFNPLKLRRKLGQILLPDPYARILHLKCKHRRILRSAASYPQPHISLMCVLNRIGKDICQHLTDTHVIPIQAGRNIMVHLHLQPDVFVLYPLGCHICQIMDQTADIVFHRHNLHFPGINLGKIQDIIDQRQQRLTCRIDIHSILFDMRFPGLAQNHFVHAKHRIDGGADLMGHTRQKFSLCLIGSQRFMPRRIRILLRLEQLHILPLCRPDLFR